MDLLSSKHRSDIGVRAETAEAVAFSSGAVSALGDAVLHDWLAETGIVPGCLNQSQNLLQTAVIRCSFA